MLVKSSIRMSNQNNFYANGSMGCQLEEEGNGRIIIRTGTDAIGASPPSVLGP